MQTSFKIKQTLTDRLLIIAAAWPYSIYLLIFSASALNGEDFALTRQFTNESPLSRLSWIISRSSIQISDWNARLGEQLAIFWLSMPHLYFTLFASFCFLLFFHLIASLIAPERANLPKTSIALLLAFPLWPSHELFFWGTVNAGYLQPLIIFMICMVAYGSKSNIEQIQQSKFRWAPLSALGFLAGLSFENTPIILALYLFASLTFFGKPYISAKTITPIIGVIFGWIILLIAPSTSFRRSFYQDMYGIDEISLEYILDKTYNVTTIFLDATGTLLSVTILLGLFAFQNTENRKYLCLLILTALASIASVIPAPYTEPRAFSLAWITMLAVCMAGVDEISKNETISKLFLLTAFGICIHSSVKSATLNLNFSTLLNHRDGYIQYLATTPACKTGIEVSTIHTNQHQKYFNNRDIWYQNNISEIERYYGCNIMINP